MNWRNGNLEWVLLALLTAIGAVLRLYHLGYNSIWLDEAYTLSIATLSLEDIWPVVSTSDFMPPLFYWLEHFMLGYGNSETVLRLLPAVFGILTIPVIYMVGKEFLDRFSGYIIATAFTASPFLISYSQEARSYSMMLFFCAVAMLAYLHIMKNNGCWGWFFFTTAAVMAFWSHYYSFLFIVALFAFIAWKFRKDAAHVLAATMTWVALTLPLLIGIYGLYVKRTASVTFGNTGINVILQFFNQISGFNSLVAVFFVFLFWIGLAWLWKNEREKSMLVIWLLSAIFLSSVILASIMPMMPRYLIFLTIPFFLAVAVSYRGILQELSGKYNPRSIAAILILCLCVSGGTFFERYYTIYSKEDWRGFSQNLSVITNDNDTVVLIPGYISSPFDYYYTNTTDKTVEIGVMTLQELQSVRPGSGTTYYVVTSDVNSVNSDGEIVSWLGNNTDLTARTGNGIYLYKKR